MRRGHATGRRRQGRAVCGAAHNSASPTLRSRIGGWAEQVEWTVSESPARRGGQRHVRWETGSGCNPRIRSVQVSNLALDSFSGTISALRNQGYRSTDRTYLLFVESDAVCGIATAPRDDAAASSRADRTVGYARVDRRCWDTGDRGHFSIAAHELMHTLGAVQATAPNGTTGAHCTDEYDVMCYDDGTGGPVTVRCRDGNSSTSGTGDLHNRLLDCGDDYFHPSPPSGSYLDRHWNTADSARLHYPNAPEPRPEPRPEPEQEPSSPSTSVVNDTVGLVLNLLDL